MGPHGTPDHVRSDAKPCFSGLTEAAFGFRLQLAHGAQERFVAISCAAEHKDYIIFKQTRRGRQRQITQAMMTATREGFQAVKGAGNMNSHQHPCGCRSRAAPWLNTACSVACRALSVYASEPRGQWRMHVQPFQHRIRRQSSTHVVHEEGAHSLLPQRRPTRLLAQPTKQSGGSASTSSRDKGWRLLDWSAYNQPWDVPWGGGTLAGGMAAWALTFLAVAFVVMPLAWTRVTGSPLWELGPAGQAQFALASEAVETCVTIALLAALTREHWGALSERDLFNCNPGKPFASSRGWLAWGLLGIVMAPLVVGATAATLTAVGYEAANGGGRGTVDGVAQMISLDTPTYLSLLCVTGVLAPFLEETVFRGFLLTSLTKRLPVWAAVLGSSAAFAVAHLSVRDAPVLFALGCLLGFLYVRSRNLLTPMLVHGVWNSTVLTLLFVLTASGVDLEQALKELR